MIPNQLNYNTIRPQGYYSYFKQWPIQPQSSNLYWNNNQIIRFLFQLSQGVMDPYRSHIQFDVQTTVQTMPVGGIQVDSSAQSFIAQSVISSNSTQIERIAQYDTLAAYLTDIGFSQYVCQNRFWQGLGYSNIPSMRGMQATGSQTGTNYFQSGPYYQSSGNTVNPTLCSQPTAYCAGGVFYGVNQVQCVSPWISGNNNSSPYTSSNPLFNTLAVSTTPDSPNFYKSLTGKFRDIRFQYLNASKTGPYIDTTTSYIQNVLNLNPDVIPSTWNQGNGYNSKTPYQVVVPHRNQVNVLGTKVNMYMTPEFIGFGSPYSSSFSKGGFQPLISPTIPQCQMQNGKILQSKVPIPLRTFTIPLISSICGILIPPDQFQLIPLKALRNLLIQLTLNPYAVFTTGYSDVHQYDQTGMNVQIKRTYKITNVSYNLHIYQFAAQLLDYIQQSLVKQIAITTTQFLLSSQYQLPTGQAVRNNFPINSSSQSVAEVICLFLANDYQKYSFCRKQFRLSNNITSMQLKYNTNFYPPQPIIGNAGNPMTLDNTGNNQQYIELLYLSGNYLFNTNYPFPRINPFNFAINERCYRVDNAHTLYPNIDITGSQITAIACNVDTAMGYPSFHENRYIGKAAFIYPFQPYGHSKNTYQGINTLNSRPFDVLFNSQPMDYFPRDQTLYIFTKINAVIVYSDKGVRVIGR